LPTNTADRICLGGGPLIVHDRQLALVNQLVAEKHSQESGGQETEVSIESRFGSYGLSSPEAACEGPAMEARTPSARVREIRCPSRWWRAARRSNQRPNSTPTRLEQIRRGSPGEKPAGGRAGFSGQPNRAASWRLFAQLSGEGTTVVKGGEDKRPSRLLFRLGLRLSRVSSGSGLLPHGWLPRCPAQKALAMHELASAVLLAVSAGGNRQSRRRRSARARAPP